MYFSKNIIIVIVSIALIFIIGCTNRVEEAEEAMRADMPDKAIELLRTEIDENPGNAKAHYKLGMAYLEKMGGKAKQKIGFFNVSGYFDDAIKRFQSAAKLESKYRKKAVDHLFDLSIASIKGNDAQNGYDIVVDGLYPLGVSKSEVFNKYWKEGEELFRKGCYSAGHRFFRIVYTVNESKKKEIARLYAKYADKAEDADDKLYLLKWGTKMHSSVGENYGRALLEKAEDTEDAGKREKLLNKASGYLSAEQMLEMRAKHYTEKFGKEPMHFSLNSNEWEKGPRVHNGDTIWYISQKSFLVKDTDPAREWESGNKELEGYDYSTSKEKGEILYVKKKEKPTDVYIWVE